MIDRYLTRNDGAEKNYSFIDGPITANNPMGVHHAWGRTYKDLFLRFRNMQGYRQRFQNGYDGQGLWIEVEVEKEKGFKSKQEIETYGVGKFVGECKARVDHFADIITRQSKRLGYFMDWERLVSHEVGREQLHDLGVFEAVPREWVALQGQGCDALVSAVRDWDVAT